MRGEASTSISFELKNTINRGGYGNSCFSSIARTTGTQESYAEDLHGLKIKRFNLSVIWYLEN